MKKIIFFGSEGYIGSHLVEFLKSKNYQISGYDVYEKSKSKALHTYKKIDISNIKDIENIDFDVDYVYYFSGITGTNVSLDNFSQFIDVNEKGLLNLLTTIKNKKLFPKLIFPTTRLVYKGVKNMPLKEAAEKEFKTIYALNKFHNENSLKMFKEYYNIPYAIFRICVPYGNTLSSNYSYGTIGFFLSQAKMNKAITLYGNGALKRTFTFVGDLCTQIVKASELTISNGEVYNIAGETYSLLEAASIIAEKFNVKVAHIEWPALALALESGDTIFDASKIDAILDNTSNTSLTDWINNL
jgi:UDP-glucose 4-epimerase